MTSLGAFRYPQLVAEDVIYITIKSLLCKATIKVNTYSIKERGWEDTL